MIRTTRRAFIAGLLLAASAAAPAQAQRALQFPPVQPVTAQHGMVVAQEARAALIGAEVLKRGGNAVDAAVAVGFAMAVTYPRAGNIGGGGFMLIHLARKEARHRHRLPRDRAGRDHQGDLPQRARARPIRRNRATRASPSACRAPSPG